MKKLFYKIITWNKWIDLLFHKIFKGDKLIKIHFYENVCKHNEILLVPASYYDYNIIKYRYIHKGYIIKVNP